MIPEKVYQEITKNKERHPEVKIIEDLVEKKKIRVKRVKENKLIKKANEFNIQQGEAEAIALYWQEKANYLATDDDNVRKKRHLLNVKIVGTPAIILKLYKEKIIKKEKFENSLKELREIRWFSDAVIDKILINGKWESQ